LHIGNYLGAIRNWVKIGEQIGKDAIFCIVDYHAITIPHDREQLGRLTFDAALANMAAGLDPNKIVLFAQSHVPEHLELGWIFSTQTPLGELERMTQFKDQFCKPPTSCSTKPILYLLAKIKFNTLS
jgi:tryptophanyl-tRNA synthetase